MANDGVVKIYIDTNANEAVKALDSTEKAFKSSGSAAEKASTLYGEYKKAISENITIMREMSLGNMQNSQKFQELAKKTKEYQEELNKTNTKVNEAIGVNNQLNSTLVKLVGGFISLHTIRKTTQYILQSVDAFREEERAILSLNTSLGNAGVYSKQYSREIQALANEIQTYSNYSNSAVIKAQAMAQAFAGNTPITQKLTKAVVDFAAATGMNLEQAFTLVGKSIGTSTNALSRYGIELNNNMSASEKAIQIAQQLEQAYHGQAENVADANIKLKNSFDELSKSIGRVFAPEVKTAQDELSKLALRFSEIINKIDIVREKWYKFNIALAKHNIKIDQKNGYTSQLAFHEADLKRYQKALEDLHKTEKNIVNNTNPKSKIENISTFSPNKTLNLSNGKTVYVKQIKDDYEKLQDAVQKARREIELAAIAHGTSSNEVQNAFVKYNQLNTELNNINSLFDTQTQKAEQQKGAYQLLNDNVISLTAKLRDLAAEHQIGGEEWLNYNTQLKEAQAELDKVNKSLEDNGIKIEDVSKQISSSISSGLVNALRNGGNAFDAFSSVATMALQKILDKLIEMSFVTPILNAFTGGTGGTLFSGIKKLFGSANGNVFSNGNIIPYAKGGIVNKPTVFPMANGAGLMGEAGAEAVMPLRRMSNGRLGVEADTKGGQVVNIYNYSGASVETRKRDDNTMDVFIKRVNDALSSERTSSGFRNAYAREDKKGVQAA